MANRIVSCNAKLVHLKKTREIEENEAREALASLKKRNAEAEEIRERNKQLSVMTHTEQMFRREEKERRQLIEKMKEHAEALGLTSITDILNNYEGTIYFYFLIPFVLLTNDI